MATSGGTYARIDGRILRLSNLDKVLFADAGLTKRDVIRYYRAIASVALPHLRDRPFTLKRYPSGIDGGTFYEKQCPFHRPSWVRTEDFEGVNYCLINDVATLIWSVNLAAIELHTTLATRPNMQRPTMMVFDLDPGEGAGTQECAQVALWIRKLLDSVSLESFVKTSGKKGLHVYVPLNTEVSYQQTQPFARSVAEHLEWAHPDVVVSKMAKKLRTRKVFIDWSQNVDFKTTTTVYSLRATPLATVSAPVSWEEVRTALKSAREAEGLASLDMAAVLVRIEKSGDLFEPILTLKQRLGAPFSLPRLNLKRAAS